MEKFQIKEFTDDERSLAIRMDNKMVNYFGDQYSIIMDQHKLLESIGITAGQRYRGKDPALVFVTAGEQELLVNGFHCSLYANSFLYIPEYYVLEFRHMSKEFNARVLVFSAEVFDLPDNLMYHLQYGSLTKPEAEVMEKFFLLLDALRRMPEDYTHQTVKVFFSMLESMLIMSRTTGHDMVTSKRTQTVFNQFMTLLRQNVTKERQVAFYAGQLGKTPSHLNVISKQQSGVSCKDWIETILMNRAKAMLSNGVGFKEASEALGFCSAAQFGTFFKKNIGMTPGEYRNGKEIPLGEAEEKINS